MNREFLKFYNQELAILREQAAEFAEEYPGIAERLGGLARRQPRSDDRRPARGRGVSGRARPAQAQARVRRFHHQSDRSARAALSRADAVLRPRAARSPNSAIRRCATGGRSRAAPMFDATYREAHRNVACRFTLAAPITLWPFEIVKAEYLTSAARVAGAGPERRRRLRREPAAAADGARAPRGRKTSRPTRKR